MSRKKKPVPKGSLTISYREDNSFHAVVVDNPALSIADRALLNDLAKTVKPFHKRQTARGAKPLGQRAHAHHGTKTPKPPRPVEHFPTLLADAERAAGAKTQSAPAKAPNPVAVEKPLAVRVVRKGKPAAASALAKLNGHEARKLQRGDAHIEATLDLHGHTQEAALARLRHFLKGAQYCGQRFVLVITGKGVNKGVNKGASHRSRLHSRTTGADGHDAPVYSTQPGVLRQKVPQWLELPDLRALVVGASEASPRHGGAGALYIQLRRKEASRRSGN